MSERQAGAEGGVAFARSPGAASRRRFPNRILLLRKGRQESRGIAVAIHRKPLPALQQIGPGSMDARKHMARNREEGACCSVLCADRAQLPVVATGSQCQEQAVVTGIASAAAG